MIKAHMQNITPDKQLWAVKQTQTVMVPDRDVVVWQTHRKISVSEASFKICCLYNGAQEKEGFWANFLMGFASYCNLSFKEAFTSPTSPKHLYSHPDWFLWKPYVLLSYIHINKVTDENVWLMTISEDIMKNMHHQVRDQNHSFSQWLNW